MAIASYIFSELPMFQSIDDDNEKELIPFIISRDLK